MLDKKAKIIIITSIIGLIITFLYFNTLIWVTPQRSYTESKVEVVWLKGRHIRGEIKFIDSPLSVWYRNMDTQSMFFKEYTSLPFVDQIIIDQVGEILMMSYVEKHGKILLTLPFSQKLYDWTK
jgi:hypothetical protein